MHLIHLCSSGLAIIKNWKRHTLGPYMTEPQSSSTGTTMCNPSEEGPAPHAAAAPSSSSTSGTGTTNSSNTSISLSYLEAELHDAHRQLTSGRVSIREASGAASRRISSIGIGIAGGSRRSSGATAAPPPSTASFVDSLEAELGRAASTVQANLISLESDAKALLLDADALARTTTTTGGATDDVKSLQRRASKISQRALQLQRQSRKDATELRRVAGLADAKLGTSCGDMVERRLQSHPYPVVFDLSNRGEGMLVVLLNDVHSILRDLGGADNEDSEIPTHMQSTSAESGEKGKDGKWVPPSSFERVTTKYWVKEQDLSQVVLASITELPLLVYGRKGGRILDRKDIIQSDAAAAQSGNNNNALWSSVTSSISSVYLDSPDSHLYNERLKRSEGAQLLRIRWYGNAKPSGDDIVYLELKTHHEKWLQDRSVKERCPIREKDVPQLLNTSTGR